MSRQRAGTSLADKAKAKAEVIRKREEIQREKNKVSGSAADKVMRERKGIAEQPTYIKKPETTPQQLIETKNKLITDHLVSDHLVSIDMESGHWLPSISSTSWSPTKFGDQQLETAAKPLNDEIITIILVSDPAITEETNSHEQETDQTITDETNNHQQETDQTITDETNSHQQETDQTITDETNSHQQETDQTITDETNSH
ncbi:MAG: hypothetical protein EOP04_06310, partial [Proteobacteria bacterium]